MLSPKGRHGAPAPFSRALEVLVNKARKIILIKESLLEKEDVRLPLFAEDMQKILRNPQKSRGTSQ